MLIDIGANLTHESFQPDFAEVLGRARAAQIVALMVTGASEQGSIDARALAHAHPDYLFSTAGIHPHHASDAGPATIACLRELLDDNRVRAVGETGLDYFRDLSPRGDQVKSFESHIELAIETGKPMFLHERDAYPDFAEVLRPYRDDLGKLVVHCFTGEQDALFAYLDLDCHIGITGWVCDERRGTHLLPLLSSIPTERLMIETDAPYLMPRNIRPRPKTRRNEPCNLPYVCQFIADALGVDAGDLAASTTRNAASFFGIALPDKAPAGNPDEN